MTMRTPLAALLLLAGCGTPPRQRCGDPPRRRRSRRGTPQRADPRHAAVGHAKLEAQADCHAGIWLHDRQAAYSAAGMQDAIESRRVGGDDYRQMKVRGYIDPGFVDHGSSGYRIDWFRRGLARGKPDDCEIFDGTPL